MLSALHCIGLGEEESIFLSECVQLFIAHSGRPPSPEFRAGFDQLV